jgi:phage baseplate assembly protein W|tara:strand:- start:7906 stop:8379 length:474 start_codon:yes stop_codon:yes gene_type:complete
MPIKIDILETKEELQDNIIYNDINLNMKVGKVVRNQLGDNTSNKDLETDVNFNAIKNSLINLFTTSPGQKILNPEFGVSFGDLLFLPVSKLRGQIIGDAIVEGIQRNENRITIISLDILADPEQQQYDVTLNFSIPDFGDNPLQLKGALSKTGFYTF